MHTATVTLPGCSHGRFACFAIGDLHSDSLAFREDRLKRYVRFITRYAGQAVAVCVGDYANGQTPGHKHFDTDATRPDYLTNMDSYVRHSLAHNERLLKPLSEAGIPVVFVEGNHDRMMGWVGYTAMLADRVGGTYLGGAGLVRVLSRVGAKSTGYYSSVVYAHHGSKGGGSPGPKVNAMQALITAWDADIYIAGHVHDGDLRVIPRYGIGPRSAGGPEIKRRHIALYRAPSFLDRVPANITTYPDRKEYGTQDEGLQWLSVHPRHGVMKRHEFVPELRREAAA